MLSFFNNYKGESKSAQSEIRLSSINDYIIDKKISEGKRAIALRGISKRDGVDVVIKMAKPQTSYDIEEYLIWSREFSIGKAASDACDYAVKHLAFFSDKIPDGPFFKKEWIGEETLWLITEFIEGYTLEQLINCEYGSDHRLAIIDYLLFLEQIFRVLDCLHENGIIHGNLTPDNIYFGTETRESFLIDFGGSCDLKELQSEDLGADGCDYNKIGSPVIFTSKLVRSKRDPASSSSYQWTKKENFDLLMKQNDIHTLLTVSSGLLYPALFDPTNPKRETIFEKQGWIRSLNFIRHEYEKHVNINTKDVFDFLKKTIEMINKNESGVTVPYVLSEIKRLQEIHQYNR